MGRNTYKRQDYKFLPMDKLREICIYKQKVISLSSKIIFYACALTIAMGGILGWVTVFTSLTMGFKYMTPVYVLGCLFAILLLFFSGGIRAESRKLTKICIILFALLILSGFLLLFAFENSNEIISGLIFIVVGILGILICKNALSCFDDMDALRPLEGFPRFIKYTISDSDLEDPSKKKDLRL